MDTDTHTHMDTDTGTHRHRHTYTHTDTCARSRAQAHMNCVVCTNLSCPSMYLTAGRISNSFDLGATIQGTRDKQGVMMKEKQGRAVTNTHGHTHTHTHTQMQGMHL